MSMKGLNLSSFKKIKEDKKSAHMQHDDGHVLIIAKSALPHLQRKALEKLPLCGGGKVQHFAEGDEVKTNDKAKDFAKGARESGASSDNSVGKAIFGSSWAEGGQVAGTHGAVAGGDVPKHTTLAKVNGFAEGGNVKKPQTRDEADSALKKDSDFYMKQMGPAPEKTAEKEGSLAETISNYFKAEGGKVEKTDPKMMAEKGDPAQAPTASEVKAATPADAKNDAEAAAMGATPEQQASNPNHITINVGATPPQGQTQMSSGPAPAPLEYPAHNNAPAPLPQGLTPMIPHSNAPGTAAVAQNAMNDANNELAATRNNALFESQKQQSAADEAAGQIQAQQKHATTIANNLMHIHKTTDDFAKEMKEINPKAFTENMGGGTKVATAIGLLLGGFGGAMKGTSNPAMDWLDRNIDRDIDAQRAHNEKTKTIYGAYKELYEDDNIAADLAKVSEYDRLKAQLNEQVHKIGTAQAINAGELGAAVIGQKQMDLRMQAASLGATQGKDFSAPSQSKSMRPNEVSVPSGMPNMQEAQEKANENNPQKIDKFVAKDPDPILTPNASSRLFNEVRLHPGFGEKTTNYEPIKNQYNQAYQADKALKHFAPTFNALIENANNIQKLGPGIPHAMAGVTGALSAAIGLAVTKSLKGAAGGGAAGTAAGEAAGRVLEPFMKDEKTRKYATEMRKMVGYISSALPGRGAEFIGDAIRDFMPDVNSTPSELKEKYEGLIGFIKDHTETGLIDDEKVGLARREKKSRVP